MGTATKIGMTIGIGGLVGIAVFVLQQNVAHGFPVNVDDLPILISTCLLVAGLQASLLLPVLSAGGRHFRVIRRPACAALIGILVGTSTATMFYSAFLHRPLSHFLVFRDWSVFTYFQAVALAIAISWARLPGRTADVL